MGIPQQRIRLRRASAADWLATNPVLLDGELGYEQGTNKLKVGNGVTPWSGLAYLAAESSSGFDGTLDSLADVAAAAAVNRSLLIYNSTLHRWEATSTWTTSTLTDGGNF